MIRLLASVRDVDEALAAAVAGADFIDLKEPRGGALGGLPPARIREVVAVLRAAHPGLPVSATIGDHTADDAGAIAAQVRLVGQCGVDYVKVGVAGAGADAQHTLLACLAALPWRVIPVFIADRGICPAAFELACRLPFPALMLDTEDKRSGSLFDCVSMARLTRFVEGARQAGKLAGLSGALRPHHVPQLLAAAPDFAGFRGALCDEGRTGTLVPGKLRFMARTLRGEALEACPG